MKFLPFCPWFLLCTVLIGQVSFELTHILLLSVGMFFAANDSHLFRLCFEFLGVVDSSQIDIEIRGAVIAGLGAEEMKEEGYGFRKEFQLSLVLQQRMNTKFICPLPTKILNHIS